MVTIHYTVHYTKLLPRLPASTIHSPGLCPVTFAIITSRPPSQCPLQNPVFGRVFLLLILTQFLLCFIDHFAAVESFQGDIILRTSKVNQAHTCEFTLAAGWVHNAVDIASQDSSREFHHGIPQVDYCMIAQRLHILPSVGPGWKHLQPSQPVEQNGDGSKVGMLP